MPFVKSIGNAISFCKDVETLKFEMESGNSFRKKCTRHDNSFKLCKTTESLLEEFRIDEGSRSKAILNSISIANKLSESLGIVNIPIPMMTSFIVDTGAGIHLRCYAKGLSMYDIEQLSLMSANGPLTANKMTRVKFRTIGDQECIVLENTPNVLSVGQLVSKGFSFVWTPADVLRNITETAVLMTPAGEAIVLAVRNFVPYFQELNASKVPIDLSDRGDTVSEPDCEIDWNVLPAVGSRIRTKTNIGLSDRQQLALDNAVDSLAVDPVNHDLLHFHSHRDCSLCREVKQRRNYSHPIMEENKHLATKVFEKTDIDHMVIGNSVPGLLG